VDNKTHKVSEIKLEIDNIRNSISANDSKVNVGNRKAYASVVSGVDVGKEVDIDTLFAEQTQRNIKEKKCCYFWLRL